MLVGPSGARPRPSCTIGTPTLTQPPQQPKSLPDLVGWIACFLGLHRFRVIEVTLGFGSAASIAKLQCERCHHVTTRCT